MNTLRSKRILARVAGLLGVVALLSAPAWGASFNCSYPAAGGSGMGGTGTTARHGGIGGTGTVAEGTGMGGTGIRPEVAAGATQLAGHVIFSQGAAQARGEDGSRALVKGSPVCVGDTIVTAPSAQVQIRMADGGMISVRSGTKLKIDVFHFDGKEDGTEKSVITLLQGGFRALTGMVGHTHKENYSIRTPFAVIGIRGTDHEPMFIPNPAPGQKTSVAPGTYDKVNSGGVVIRNAEGSVNVKPDQVGFVPNDPASMPMLLKEVPGFYRPGARGAGREGASRRGGEGEMPGGRHGHEGAGEHRESTRIHVPEPHANEVQSPEMRMPEIQTPEAPEAPGTDD
jgi:hypothetical protein